MKSVRAFGLVLAVLLVAALGVTVLLVRSQRHADGSEVSRKPAAPAEAPAARKIRATLYYVAQDGERLVEVDGEVPYAAGVLEQATEIVQAELAQAPVPLLPAVPQGTRLRALYVTSRGEAYVDLSREIVTGQQGGSLPELLTVYALVNALTANLPAVHSVQLLVDGHEVDTLAGHVDLRHPLARSRQWLETSRTPAETD
jgi:spore germination protein GerM